MREKLPTFLKKHSIKEKFPFPKSHFIHVTPIVIKERRKSERIRTGYFDEKRLQIRQGADTACFQKRADLRGDSVTGLMNCPETALFSCPSTAQYRVQELAVLTGRVILPVFSVTPDNHLLH